MNLEQALTEQNAVTVNLSNALLNSRHVSDWLADLLLDYARTGLGSTESFRMTELAYRELTTLVDNLALVHAQAVRAETLVVNLR